MTNGEKETSRVKKVRRAALRVKVGQTNGKTSELFFGPIMISDTAHFKISSLNSANIFLAHECNKSIGISKDELRCSFL